MGKGGGCMPSKKKTPIGVADELPLPVEDSEDDVVTDTEHHHHQFQQQHQQVTDNNNNTNLKIFIVFYSMYGHVEGLAKRMKKGVDGVEGIEAVLYRVPETLSDEVLEKMKAPVKDQSIAEISAEELAKADGVLFGFPTRYGCMAAQMKAFFDSTGKLWKEQKMAGKPAGFFVSTGTQGGGQETTWCFASHLSIIAYLEHFRQI